MRLFLCLPCLLQSDAILFMTCLCVCVDCTDTFGDDGFSKSMCVYVCIPVFMVVDFSGESFPLCLLTQELT